MHSKTQSGQQGREEKSRENKRETYVYRKNINLISILHPGCNGNMSYFKS